MMPKDELRATLYHRFYLLLPLVALPAAKWLWRTLVWAFWLTYFGFVALVLVLRYSVLPHVDDYRADIERYASQGLGQKVSIGRIEASWEGVNPDLTLIDVSIADTEGRPALTFSRVEAILSWWSVPSAQLKLRLLRIDEPTLNLRRDANGRISIAGIPLSQEKQNNDISDWILAQRRIRIQRAMLVWDDELRKAPTLVLENLNFGLDNNGSRHGFGLTAQPPAALASKLDVRGDLRGADFEALESWAGQVYAEIDYADLAVWRQWVDYPVALPHGRGAWRAWFGFAEGKLDTITADVALQDVSLRLAQDLPALELEHMSGRMGVNFSAKGLAVNGRRIELATRKLAVRNDQSNEAILIEPTDFHVDWQPDSENKRVVGSATASVLDIDALAALAAYLPFDAGTRQLLNDYAPRGRVRGLSAKWKGDAERLQTYALKAGFDGLALKAQGYFPGFTGMSGSLDVNEQGGSATLHSKKPSVDLPSIFPESLISLDSLGAQATWKINKGVLDVALSQVEFAGAEAAGTAQGTYRNTGEGPGSIDLTAALTRGDARAVWRYMPKAVNADARYWLRDSLLSGSASDARLTLKGNLADFPFLDKTKGQFLVTVKANDVTLDYGTGWPKITGIYGDLRFEGAGMKIDIERGTMLGAHLEKTYAEIPDFDAPVSLLIVKGRAKGPTSEFLKFIDQSPVAARIDHFTEGMRAGGNGHLDLELEIPLAEARLGESKINGTYYFENNEVTVDAALPPFRQVNGTVQFSGNDLRVPEINATLFGGPLKIKGGTQKDGRVLITANGSISVAQLRKQFNSPLLQNFSGAASYRGEVRINKRDADLVVESALVGLASDLPEPFNKTATETLPLRFEKEFLPGAPMRDQISVSLGSAVSMKLIRSKQVDGFVPERGAIAIGRPLELPERGVMLGMTAKKLDIDFWRRLLQPVSNKTPAEKSAPPFLDSINIKTGELLLLGRTFNDVDLTVSPEPNHWKASLNSRQASGDLQWYGAGSGKLVARFKHMAMDPAAGSAGSAGSDMGEGIKELPALDIVAEEFSLGVRRFGRLELQAQNEGGVWRLGKINVTNPYGNLSGSGQWQIGGGKNRTDLDFKMGSSDVGKLLERMGYPGTVRGGTAQLGGKIGWNGAPSSMDYASLGGEMNLEAAKGQFVKLDPGAAGKLLGLISLQGLTRRVSLDFKDVFSEGFAFDSIASKVVVQHGQMSTDRLQIDGPGARVLMRGEVDLKNETQRLNVNVQPELGGTAALGVALINPIAGVATWVAHKVLQNPLNHMFGFDYLITGKWDDPKVEKLSGNEPVLTAPRLPMIPNVSGVANEPALK